MHLSTKEKSHAVFGKLNAIATVLLIVLIAVLTSCDTGIEESPVQVQTAPDPNAVDFFNMRNAEIRQDIINELSRQNIEHWLNDDGSIGFYARDTELIDNIGIAAIGAYAARN